MILIAVDPHKSSHTALAVDPAGRELGQLRVEARAHRRLLRWARQWPERRWAVEGAAVSATASASGCSRRASWSSMSRRGWWRACACSPVAGSPTPQDARAIALAAQPLTALRAVRAEDDTAVLRLLSDRRDEFTRNARAWSTGCTGCCASYDRVGAPPGSPPIARRRSYARLRPTGAADRERLRMARALVREVRVLDRQPRRERPPPRGSAARTRQRPHAHPGVGVILAAKIVGRSGAVSRSPRARTTPATRGRRRLRYRAGRSNAIASAAVETAS